MKATLKYSSLCFFAILTINSRHRLEVTQPEIVQKIYQIMKDMHSILSFHKINYWVDGGTMLGAVRHKGLIPWDDDLDISIEKRQEVEFVKLFPLLISLKYRVKVMHFGYKIYPENGLEVPNMFWRYPFCDVFVQLQENEKIFYRYGHPDEPKRDGELNYSKVSEIFPLKEYDFGPIKVLGPNNPIPYLETWYGKTWNIVGYKSFDHSKEMAIKKKIIILTKEEKKPILPTAPLEEKTF